MTAVGRERAMALVRPFGSFAAASSSRLFGSTSRSAASIAPVETAIPTYADPTPLVRTTLDPSARPPLKPTHGIHVATLYLAAHHPYNLDLYSRFAVQSARSLGIPTTNPANLPMSKELHTVPRGPFVHKKYQENFERRTHRRAIKVFDANREVVDLLLRYLKRNGIGGVGMRARVHEFVEFGFGRKEVEGLEKQLDGVEGGVEEIEKAAEQLIKTLSEPAGEEEHRRVLQEAGESSEPVTVVAEAPSVQTESAAADEYPETIPNETVPTPPGAPSSREAEEPSLVTAASLTAPSSLQANQSTNETSHGVTESATSAAVDASPEVSSIEAEPTIPEESSSREAETTSNASAASTSASSSLPANEGTDESDRGETESAMSATVNAAPKASSSETEPTKIRHSPSREAEELSGAPAAFTSESPSLQANETTDEISRGETESATSAAVNTAPEVTTIETEPMASPKTPSAEPETSTTASETSSASSSLPKNESTREIFIGETEAAKSTAVDAAFEATSIETEPTASETSSREPETSTSAPTGSSLPANESTDQISRFETESATTETVPSPSEPAAPEPDSTPTPTESLSTPSSEAAAAILSSETSDSITPSESPSITASSSPEEPITTEAIKEAATLQAAPAPEASEETMSDSDAMTEALKSETEPETLTGELSAVRTPENPTESTTGEDVLPDGGVEAAADGSTGSSPPVAQQEAAQVGGKDAKMRAEIGSTLASTVQAVEKDEAKVDAVAQKAEDAQAEAIENTEKKP